LRTLNLDYVSGATDQIIASAPLTVGGAIRMSLSAIAPQAGTYTLLSAPSRLSGAALELVNNTNFTGTLSSSATAITMTGALATPLTNAYRFGGQVSGAGTAMAISSGTAGNWARLATDTSATAAGVVPGSTANVFFATNTGATHESNVVLGANMAFNSLTFNDTSPVTIGADGNTLTLLSTGSGTSAISAN
jgi:hypothetical protein